eukprot:16319196-Heterocapsa_arctica.AAC.1
MQFGRARPMRGARGMATDSRAVFKARVAELGLTERTERFESFAWLTFGAFVAFSSDHVPGTGDATKFELETPRSST